MSLNPPVPDSQAAGLARETAPGPVASSRKRRWQTRALTIILGISVGLYLLSQLGHSVSIPQASRTAENEKMVATAKQIGGMVHSEGVAPGWEGWVHPEQIQIHFRQRNFDDRLLELFIADADRGPTALCLSDASIHGAGLRKLGSLTRLEAFTVISRRQLSAAARSADSVEPFPSPELQIGRGDLAGLCRLPNLRMLDIERAGFSADAFRGLPPSSSVVNLILRGSDVRDESLADLGASFPAVVLLNLEDTGITDAGLKHLSSMEKLQFLTIGVNSRITPEGLKTLKDVPALIYLDLSRSGLLPGDFDELRTAKLNLTIQLSNRVRLKPLNAAR